MGIVSFTLLMFLLGWLCVADWPVLSSLIFIFIGAVDKCAARCLMSSEDS